MPESERSQELAEADFDWLDSMLSRVVGGRIPNVEALDGFMTALVVSPDLIKPSEYVPIIVSGKTEDGDLVFESADEVRQFYDVLVRYWNEISEAFGHGEIRMPYLAENAEGVAGGNDWANGFLTGTHVRHGIWRKIANDEQRGGPFVPIWALAYEHDPDPSMRPYDHPMPPERREELIAGMIGGVTRLYRMFREGRTARTAGAPFPKVGRNDPCPCGSGKKFKLCCARLTFH